MPFDQHPEIHLCRSHYRALRQALYSRGLGPWVAKSEAELDKKEAASEYEPMYSAIVEIYRYVAFDFQSGLNRDMKCPICHLNRRPFWEMVGRSGWTWIDEFANTELERARCLGLVSFPS